jgi:hypothetical protein
MKNNLKIYLANKSLQDKVLRWLHEYWRSDIDKISTWDPDSDGAGTWGVFVDGATKDLKDDLEEVFEGVAEVFWEE